LHYVYIVPGDKLAALIQIVETENPESAVVFCNTKDETKRVAAALDQQGYAADWLNADLAQNDREKVMEATRRGELRFLVATDVAARGIDISHLTHVINFDFPESAEGYVHRTGRTGRAGRTGIAIALVGPRDVGNLYMLRLTYKLRPIERQLPSAVEKKTRQEADLLRMFVDAFAARRQHPDDLALARRVLTHDQAEVLIAGLLRDHLGVRPDALEEATAARRARAPTPTRTDGAPDAAPKATPDPKIERRPEPPRRQESREKRAPRAPRAAEPRTESLAHANDEPDLETPSVGAVAEIYVSVGRRDGAKPSDIQAVLESAGVAEDEVGYVRVRHRHAFVGVKGEALERALGALHGAMIANRKATAEPARRS
jgi:ATP-dependent RNA helicase DeaD